jgi:cytochrome o ubiquinol oxidase subunit 2
MRFMVHAVPASEFESWLARTRGEGPALNADAYSQLERPGSNTQVQTYGSVDPSLFERIVQQAAPRAASPHQGH